MIEYRKATIDDISLLVKTRIEFLNDVNNISTEEDREQLRINNTIYFENAFKNNSFIAWIALYEGNIVATSGLTFYFLPPNMSSPDGKTAYIGNMYTLPDFRNQGIASHLFDLIMNEAKSLGCKKVLLNATDAGKSVYEKYGFLDAKSSMVYHF